MRKFINTFLIVQIFSQYVSAQNQVKEAFILQHQDTVQFYEVKAFNSSFREANPYLTSGGDFMIFMSSRGGESWSTAGYSNFKGNLEYDGDIWISKRISKTAWEKPFVFPKINTSNGEDEPNISEDGKTLFFQSWRNNWDRDGGPYYMIRSENGKFNSIKGLGGKIALFFRILMGNFDYSQGKVFGTDGMCISRDEKVFIIAAGEYNGNMDLYISRKDEKNKWTYPKKLSINTKQDERCPFLASDNKTLYFSSNGYTNLGGKDIFKTNLLEDNRCGEVINLGSPINTKYDDQGFIIDSKYEEIFMIKEGDIYFMDIKGKLQSIKPSN